MSDHFGNIPIQVPKSSLPAEDNKPKQEKKPTARPTPAKPTKKRGRKGAKKSRLWLWPLGIALVFGLYSVIGFFGIPYYARIYFPESFHEATGMTLDPGRVSFNPFTFRFMAQEAQVLSVTGPAFLSLKSFSADLAPISLLRHDLVSNAINIDQLDLNVTREQDGTYNFDQLFRRKKAQDSELLDFSDLPFFFSLNNIAIRNSRILFNDLPANKTHTITDIHLDLPSFSNIPFRADRYIHPRFSAVVNGSPVELSGQAHLGEQDGPNLVTNLSCELHGLDLPIYSEYLPVDLPFLFKKGKAEGKLDFHFNPAAKADDKLSVGFDLKIADTELQTPDESIVVAAPTAELRGQLQPVAQALHFTAISFTEPVVQSYGKSFLKNINSLIKREKPSPATGKASTSPFVLATDALALTNGSFHHFQKQQAQKPELSWRKLELQVKDYSTVAKGEKAKGFGSFLLSGEQEGSSAAFSWQGNFVSPENMKGTLKLSKMDFPELLQALGMDKKFDVQGAADLQGELSFPFSTGQATKVGYKLVDTTLSVQNFKLIETKKTVLSAPLVQATGMSTAGKAIDWGTISLRDGVAVFLEKKIPDFFDDFNTEKNRVQGLDLEGQVTLVPTRKGKPKINFTNISLKAANLVTPEKAKNNFTLTAQTTDGGAVTSKGDMRLSPFALAAKTEFSGLAAADIFPLFSGSEFFNALTGTLAGDGVLSFPQQSFAGDLRLTKGQIQKTGKALCWWEDTVLQGVNYTSKPFHLGITLASIDQPEYTWQIGPKDDDPLQQLALYFQKQLPTEEKPPGDKGKINISTVDIQEVRIAGGRFPLLDSRMKPKWQGQISDFTGSIKEIHQSAASGPGTFSFTGKLDEAPLLIEGALDLFAKNEPGKYHVQLQGYPLSAFHKQLAAKTDIDTREGEFSLTLNGFWQEGSFRNSGSLVLSDVKPTSEKADSALPLALLTGADDTFRLDFDLERSLPPAKTTLAEEIISAWETKTVKAAVSPLLLASGEFQDLIGNEFAECVPGESAISENGAEILNRYAALLESHPYLGLTLSGSVNKEQDREAIKLRLQAAEQQRVNALNQKRLEEWQDRKAIYEKKLQEPTKAGPNGKITEITMPPDILAGFTPIQPEPVVVKDAMLLELAQKRLNAVHQYLTTQLTLDPSRIALLPAKKLADAENSASGVKIGLKATKR